MQNIGNAALIDSRREGLFTNRLDEIANKLKSETEAFAEETKNPDEKENEPNIETNNLINLQIPELKEENENAEFKSKY